MEKERRRSFPACLAEEKNSAVNYIVNIIHENIKMKGIYEMIQNSFYGALQYHKYKVTF
jgi:hypothetical protein